MSHYKIYQVQLRTDDNLEWDEEATFEEVDALNPEDAAREVLEEYYSDWEQYDDCLVAVKEKATGQITYVDVYAEQTIDFTAYEVSKEKIQARLQVKELNEDLLNKKFRYQGQVFNRAIFLFWEENKGSNKWIVGLSFPGTKHLEIPLKDIEIIEQV